ncbi:uncharacterized protein LOC120709500 isoform X1 [Panicum virgatum]|uniref:uncharacterized protein LOC120709500 isoform X1 n=1 Tax=Panicum virgatum TaxID=38727 RepID=UPI0019D5FC6C|nr:uncharacterized protein LOC120709500 isoform X1 [Panicum virgatum]
MTGCSYPQTYDGIGADKYMEWEIAIDNIFATRFMCPMRRVKNASSILRHFALSWWESLGPLDKPHTWDDMKIVMRENFVNPSLVINSNDEVHQLDNSLVIPPTMPKLLQDHLQKSEDDVTEPEVLTTSCANLEPSPNIAAAQESNGDATLTEGESSLDVLKFSTNHAMMEQLLVEPSLDFYLSQDDLLDIPCDKDDLHDHEHESTEPPTCAELKHVNYIGSCMNELKLISSLKTLGYIEFDVLCNLSDLEEQLFQHAELPWCPRHTYHAIGKYDNNRKYLIHRVYFCANLNFPFVVQDCNQLNGSNTTDSYMPSIPMLAFVSTNLLQDSVEKDFLVQDHAHSDQGACRISFEYNWRRGWLFFQEGENDEDMIGMYMSKYGEWCEDEGDLKGFSSRQSLSGSSPQGGGPKQLKFESTSESWSSPHQK